MQRIIGITAAALLSGCCTVLISSPGTLAGVDVKGADGKADRVIMVANEGYYLFQMIPIVSGDVYWDETENEVKGGIRLFSEQLVPTRMLNAICRYAERENCELVDVVINDKYIAPIGLFDIQSWFTTIIGYSAVTYSGVLKTKEAGK